MKYGKEINGKFVVIETDEFTKNVWERNGFEPVDDSIDTVETEVEESVAVVKNKGGRPRANK